MVTTDNYGSAPNYPSPLSPNTYLPLQASEDHEIWTGRALYNLQPVTDEDYVQARWLWHVLGRTEHQQDHLVHNVAVHLFAATSKVRERTYGMFDRVDADLGARIRQETERVRAEKGLSLDE
jgi:catalase